MKHLPLALLAGLAVAAPAHAFGIDAHRQLTARAIALEAAEWPALAVHAGDLAVANVAEDLNVVVKWGFYNHYFNPMGAVRTSWRATSDARVAGLWTDIEAAIRAGDAEEAWDRAGHLLHHIQDMASPPHVIPVEHGLGDGFERYPIGPLVAGAQGTRVPAMGGIELHEDLARRTWDAVETGSYDRCGRTIRWEQHWAPERGEFGRYGGEGNRFGDAADCPEEADAMHAFAEARVEDAVGYSRTFLRDVAARLDAHDGLAAAQ